jgi:pheromone shutdown protein TraB
MAITILGIRHHGVGSARNVVEMLEKLKPDLIFVEGPPELDAVTKWVGEKDLKPPVSILCYDVDSPQRASFYPFAEFSPEWQAMLFAKKNNIPVRMMDLPMSISWALQDEKRRSEAAENAGKMTNSSLKNAKNAVYTEGSPKCKTERCSVFSNIYQTEQRSVLSNIYQTEQRSVFSNIYQTEQRSVLHSIDAEIELPVARDPIGHFAKIAGYDDSEMWWEHNFEQRHIADTAEAHFEAVMLMMSTLREHDVKSALDEENGWREAYMAQQIRQAQREMYENIVVVCGAWHAPALLNLDKTEAAHAKIIKKMPKSKIRVGTTWIPWTNDRLAMSSGYGAGIVSPGWYSHVWKKPKDKGELWLTKVAQLFRQKKMDISTAHVIEAYRLAEAVSALRGLGRIGLLELNEATQTVMCMGDGILLELVKKELIVGHGLGKVPDALPKLPLQADFEEKARKLKLKQTADFNDIDLDLRKELDLNRSIFLHRLVILGINWGKESMISSKAKGTFKESWRLQWKPEMLVDLIEKGIWGNSIDEASSKFLLDKAAKTDAVSALSEMIQTAIPAELFTAIAILLQKINDLATVSADILELMAAITPLADVGRYGNVRKTDLVAINTLVEGLILRVCIGLPNACYGLDDAASQRTFEQIRKVNDAVQLLENPILREEWFKTLTQLTDKSGVHPVIRGCTTRLLFDFGCGISDFGNTELFQILNQQNGNIKFDETTPKSDIPNPTSEWVAVKFSFALSTGNEPSFSAGWIEGFLKGSGMILLYDDLLWNLLYKWVSELKEDIFTELLPILRRTFSKYAVGERRQLGEKARKGVASTAASEVGYGEDFDYELADSVLPLALKLLGLS